MILQLRKCDLGLSINGVKYDFTPYVSGVTLEQTQAKHLTRGATGQHKKGFVYTEGLKDPNKIAIVLTGLPAYFFPLLRRHYQEETRMDCYVIDRKTGQARYYKNAIITQEPAQLTMGEGTEELDITLNLEAYETENTGEEDEDE